LKSFFFRNRHQGAPESIFGGSRVGLVRYCTDVPKWHWGPLYQKCQN